MRELLYTIRSIFIIVFSPFLSLWYIRYWFKCHNKILPKEDLNTPKISGYTDKMFYHNDDNLKLFLSSEKEQEINITIYKVKDINLDIIIDQFTEKVGLQEISNTTSSGGCNWELSREIRLNNYEQGYYKIVLNEEFILSFIVGNNTSKADITIVAPVTTWVAYNYFGGKSAYDNYLDDKTVHFLSTDRPNVALEYNPIKNIHDMNVETNIYNWFAGNYNVNIVPDYALEYQNIDSKIIVLSYHCEYFSSKMYKALQQLSKRSSIISLGANQVYWKVNWHNDYTKLELRKDMSFFERSTQVGGQWKHSFQPENKLLNASYSDAGIGTYAPYKVLKPNHWLFNGLDVEEGQLFGEKGINTLGICGDETDKASFISKFGVAIIAKGINPVNGEMYQNYNSSNDDWDSGGGGEISYRLNDNKKGILNTGSIQSGSGLGVDPVFTTIIKNFIKEYIN